jgi:hypothetical protein
MVDGGDDRSSLRRSPSSVGERESICSHGVNQVCKDECYARKNSREPKPAAIFIRTPRAAKTGITRRKKEKAVSVELTGRQHFSRREL